MKKYVAKEDVEKGLVDPNKPLAQQQEYVAKIQKQNEHKPQRKQNTQEKKKRYRQNKTQYNWNKFDVTPQTPVPDAPKKVLPEPDTPKFKEQLANYKQSLEELYEQKQELIRQMKTLLKTTSENRKKGFAVNSKFSQILKDKNNAKMMVDNDVKLLQEKRDSLNNQLELIKNKVNNLKKPQNLEDCSTQQLQRRLQKTQTKLTTADVDKKQQTIISHKITDIKRAMLKSKSQIQINTEIGRLNDEDHLVFEQLKAVKSDLYGKYKELKQIKSQIYQILKEKQAQEPNKVQQTRSNEEIKVDYENRINKVTEEREKIKQKIDSLKKKHNKNLDDYYDQQDLLNYRKMVLEQKKFIEQKERKRQQFEEKRKKEREEREKQKKKEFQQRERRREEKKKREEERKKLEEQKREKLQKQREQFINRNPHHEEIDTCEYLMNYCELLKPENAEKAQKKEEKVYAPIQELKSSENKEWEKQIKRGAEVIISKKLLNEDEAPQKNKKQKKKKQKVQQNKSGFTHHSDISDRFQKVHVLPPLALNQVDEVIVALKQKLQFFSKPTEEEIQAFKERAEKQFDRIHGFNRENDKRTQYKEKDDEEELNERKAKKQQKVRRGQKKEEIRVNENEFPELD